MKSKYFLGQITDTKENSEDSQESDSAKNSEELKVANSGEENQADTSSKNAKQQSNTELAFTLENPEAHSQLTGEFTQHRK